MEPPPNQLVTCPYNKAHQVEHYRLQVHLAKCSKQYPEMRIVKCPFDATHYVKEDELNHHVINCRQREMLDTQLYVTDDDYKPEVQIVASQADFTSTENWDDDNVQTYRPQEAKKNAPIYQKIKGATKSERNRFRYENSIKFSQAQAKGSGASNQ